MKTEKINLKHAIVSNKKYKNYVFYQFDDLNSEIQTVCLIFKTGSIWEKKNLNGSAHILEHMIVHYISEKMKACYGESVLCVGITEYDHIMIRIDCYNKFDSEIQYCFEIFNQILEGKMLDERLFNISLREVFEEYLSKKELVEEQRRIIYEVTCKDIHHHPVGKLCDLRKIKFSDVIGYFFYCLKNVERAVVLIGMNKVSDKDIERLKLFPVYKDIKKVSTPRHVQLGKFYSEDLLRYFLISYAQTDFTSIERILIMDILEKRYNFYLKKRIGIFDKVISKDYQFIYLSGNIKEECEIDIVTKKIVADEISQGELNSSKKSLSKYITDYRDSKQVQNTTSKLRTIIRNFMYGDDILFIDDYDIALSDIESVQLNQINYKIQNYL